MQVKASREGKRDGNEGGDCVGYENRDGDWDADRDGDREKEKETKHYEELDGPSRDQKMQR